MISPYILLRSFIANGACSAGSCEECKKMFGFKESCPAINADDEGNEIPPMVRREFAKELFSRMNEYIEQKYYPPFKEELTDDDIMDILIKVVDG